MAKEIESPKKEIGTLVHDIHELFNNGHVVDPDFLSKASTDFFNVIDNRLNEYKSPRDHTGLRMSNIGKPTRQLWYDNHVPAVSDLTADTKIKFMFGDILEIFLLYLAREAGHTVEHQQLEVTLDGIVGHIDAIIDGVLVDCKSASTHSYKRFASGGLMDDDPFGYIDQLAGYSRALGGIDAGFLVIDKTLGHICWCPYTKEELAFYNPEAVIERNKRALESLDPPPRCYEPKADGKSGNLVLDTVCSYCAHKFRCWSDANDGIGLRTFLYSTGPKHLVHVEREPNGPHEITF